MKEISIEAAAILVDLSGRIRNSEEGYSFEPSNRYIEATDELVTVGLLRKEEKSYKPTSELFKLSSKFANIKIQHKIFFD